MEEILPPVLCLREQQPLLRTIAKTLAHGAADAKHAPHVDEVFQTLIGGAYIGLELSLNKSLGAIALFQHEGGACGPLFVPQINPNSKLASAAVLTIKAPPTHTQQALLRVPLLCSDQGADALLLTTSADALFDTWMSLSSAVPVVGSLLVAVPTGAVRTASQLERYMTNALLLCAVLGPLIAHNAQQRLLHAALSGGVLAKLGITSAKQAMYVAGKGFVSSLEVEEEVDGRAMRSDDRAGGNALAARLLHMLQEQGDDELEMPIPMWQQCRDEDVDSSNGSVDCGKGGLEEEEEDAVNDDTNRRRTYKRQRCNDDALSCISKRKADDDDEEDGGKSEDYSSAGSPSGSGVWIAGGGSNGGGVMEGQQQQQQQQCGGSSTSGSSGGGDEKKKSVVAVWTAPARLSDGLQYADTHLEGRFVTFMQRDMAWVKRLVLLCFMIVLLCRMWQAQGHMTVSGMAWDMQAIGLLSVLNSGLVFAVQCLPTKTIRWAWAKEGVTVALYLLLGIPSVLLQTRHWLSVWSGQLVLHRTMPLLTLVSLLDNGSLFRLLRTSWTTRVCAVKRVALLAYVATTVVSDNTLPHWVLPVTVAFTQAVTIMASWSTLLEKKQRQRFERMLVAESAA